MLVRESVNFIRGGGDEESVKTNLFGIRVGQIVIPSKLPPFPNSRSGVTMPAYLVEFIHDGEEGKRSLRLLGIGYFYNLNFRNPGDTPSQWFSFSSGFSTSLGNEEDYKPIDSSLKEMILDSLKKEPERKTWEVHKMNFYDRSNGAKILLKEELFHRSSTKSQIKDKLIGFRPGSIITSAEPWPENKPYKEVYMYIKKGEKFNDQGNPIIVTYIGALSKRDGKLSQFLVRHKKMLGETVIWEENKRSLTPEELQKVQKTFAEIPSYPQKIYDETGIKPSLNESINFERGINPKVAMGLGVYSPGRLFKYEDSHAVRPEFPSVFAYIERDKTYNYYFYIGRFINPKESLTGTNFTFGGSPQSDNRYNLQKIKDDHMVLLSEKEKKELRKVFSDENNQDIVDSLQRKMKAKILLESLSFQRGKSEREIKDLLGEWRPGKLVINPHTNIIYVFLGMRDEENAEIFSLGHLRNIGNFPKTYLKKYKKATDSEWARTNLKPTRNLRTLTDEEYRLVKPSLYQEYINKVKENFGIDIIIP